MRFTPLLALVLWCAPVTGADPIVPSVNARSLFVLESSTGTVLAERNADQRLPPASLTKLMTAYILFGDLRAGRLRLDENVAVSRDAARLPGARMFLNAGETVTVENLLQGMLVQSGNDATRALVEHVSGDQATFVARMNESARTLGLTNTHYVNAGGLHRPDHYSSTRDVATLAARLRAEFPEYRHWFKQREFTWAGITQPNRNTLLRDPNVDGIKTGHTEAAGFNLAVSARRGNTEIIAVVFGSDSEADRVKAGKVLLQFAFRNFETRMVRVAGVMGQVPVWYGASSRLDFGLAEQLAMTLPIDSFEKMEIESQVGESFDAPIVHGQPVGQLTARVDGKVAAERPLIALVDVPEAGWLGRATDRLRKWLRQPTSP